MVFNVGEANVFESLVDIFRDLGSFLRRPSPSWLQVNDGNAESIDWCDHVA